MLDAREEGRRRTARAAPARIAAAAAGPGSLRQEPADIFEAGGVVYMTQPLSRPEALPGQTYKIRWPDSEHALYITLNDIVQDGRRRPFEVFINSKNMEHYAWTVALTRMISAVFRRGGDVSFVVEEMKAVFDPRGGAWMDGRYVPSLLAAIGDVIERHMIEIGFLPAKHQRDANDASRKLAAAGDALLADQRSRAHRPGAMPEMRRSSTDPPRRLRPVHQLRLFEMLVTRSRALVEPRDIAGVSDLTRIEEPFVHNCPMAPACRQRIRRQRDAITVNHVLSSGKFFLRGVASRPLCCSWLLGCRG